MLTHTVVDNPRSPTGLTVRFVNDAPKPVVLPIGHLVQQYHIFVCLYRPGWPSPFDPITNLREPMPPFVTQSDESVTLGPGDHYDWKWSDVFPGTWFCLVNDPDREPAQRYDGDWCVQACYDPDHWGRGLDTTRPAGGWRPPVVSPVVHVRINHPLVLR